MSDQKYIGTTEAAQYLGISTVRLRILLQDGRVEGAKKVGRSWSIPLFNGMPVVNERNKGPKGTWHKRRRKGETCILLNRKIVGKNALENENEPPIVVKEGKKSYHCHEIEIDGPCRIVYRADETGPGGVRFWIETSAEVPVIRKIF